jgi:transposase
MVPGRKSDVNDAQWLQRLHACGLLRPSFRPDREIAALRTYLRLRERHLDYSAAHIQHTRQMGRSHAYCRGPLNEGNVVSQGT